MSAPAVETRRVVALMAVTEFVAGYGMVTMDPESEDDAKRRPEVPIEIIDKLVREGRVADGRGGDSGHPPRQARGERGEPGGSDTAQGDEVQALRAEYLAMLGKRPFSGWPAEELRKRIAAHLAAQPALRQAQDERDEQVP